MMPIVPGAMWRVIMMVIVVLVVMARIVRMPVVVVMAMHGGPQ
jgi:hypothetical protein